MSATDPTIKLAAELIRKASVTPLDAGCQDLLEKRLVAAGFNCVRMNFEDVSNLWARFGDQSPLVCFAGHTDVVPPGDSAAWLTDPFEPVIADGKLYGRGAADMKGGLAAMFVAAEQFVAANSNFRGSIAFLITSDEEGIAINGTQRVMRELEEREEKIDFCIVGEPSSSEIPGDTIRIGRRGSLTGRLRVNGIQGHVAYAHLAKNPVRAFSPALSELNATIWDKGNAQFPPTTFEITHLHCSSGADNVIPAELEATFNFRFSTEWDDKRLRVEVERILKIHELDYVLEWHFSGAPFITAPGKLTDSARQAIAEVADVQTEFSTGGGTSDGRFIAPYGVDVIELGLCNATIHQVNEHVTVSHLPLLSKIYQRTLELLFS